MPKPWHGSYARFLAALLAGQCKPLRLHDGTGEYEEAEHVIPVGGLYLSAVSTDPGLPQVAGGLGYGAWARYAQGRCVVGANDTNWAAGTESGAETATPNGTCSAPSFTGNPITAVPAHTHPVAITDPGHNHTQNSHNHAQNSFAPRIVNSGTAGTVGVQGASTASNANASNSATTATNQGTTATNNANTTGITASTSAPVGAPASVPVTGTCSAPTFTGQAMSVVQPSIAVYVWRRVG